MTEFFLPSAPRSLRHLLALLSPLVSLAMAEPAAAPAARPHDESRQDKEAEERLRQEQISNSSSSAQQVVPAPAAPALALSQRSKYKTYILSNAVFEVEQRYEIREIIGQGAYGVVWSVAQQTSDTARFHGERSRPVADACVSCDSSSLLAPRWIAKPATSWL